MLGYMIAFCKLCVKHHTPLFMENPMTSRVWWHELILQFTDAVIHRVDYCQYGTAWRKATRILEHGSRVLHTVCRCCKMTNSRCSATHKRHFVLVGKDSSGTNWTRRACPYPKEMCDSFATVLVADCIDQYIISRSMQAGIFAPQSKAT